MRLIDADALQNILLPITTALEHEYGSLGGAVSGCMKHIDNASTIDAIPVVRCWECKKKNKKKCPMTIVNFGRDGKEVLVQNHVPDDFYCAAGERKEGADND